jgi:NAD(P)-dependent dehydrogenase (short-subunit alcohol dehydrogenase family)
MHCKRSPIGAFAGGRYPREVAVVAAGHGPHEAGDEPQRHLQSMFDARGICTRGKSPHSVRHQQNMSSNLPLPDLTGRIALVTGGGRGIGRATARDLASGGAAVAVVSRTAEQLDEVVATVAAHGGHAVAFAADLADLDQIPALLAHIHDRLGLVDILINDAATVAPLGPTAELNPAQVDAAFRLNVTSLIALSGAVLPDMLERAWGRIVNISTGVVSRPASMIGGTTYTATKAAVEAHTINLAAELADSGVTVNGYRPGRVDTAMQEWIRSQDPGRVGKQLVARFAAMHAEGQLISAERSARRLVTRLAGSDTGHVWDVDDPLV